MGEIGINRHEYMYELPYWEIVLIVRGYSHRNREMWSAVRWQTYNLMCVSMADMKKAGIFKPTDLMKFPWERDNISNGNLPNDEEIEQMRRQMREENARNNVNL